MYINYTYILYTYINILYIYINIYIYIYIYVYMYVCIYICMYICMYVYKYNEYILSISLDGCIKIHGPRCPQPPKVTANLKSYLQKYSV